MNQTGQEPSKINQRLQVAMPTVLSERHSNSTFKSAFPTVLSERHSKSLPTPPTQKLSKKTFIVTWVRFVVISLCCVVVAVGSGFVIFETGCDRVRFSVVVGTIWLQYGPSCCSRDYFPPKAPSQGLRRDYTRDYAKLQGGPLCPLYNRLAP